MTAAVCGCDGDEKSFRLRGQVVMMGMTVVVICDECSGGGRVLSAAFNEVEM